MIVLVGDGDEKPNVNNNNNNNVSDSPTAKLRRLRPLTSRGTGQNSFLLPPVITIIVRAEQYERGKERRRYTGKRQTANGKRQMANGKW